MEEKQKQCGIRAFVNSILYISIFNRKENERRNRKSGHV